MLIENDITPFVTLYHWDLPENLNPHTDNGGWLNPDVVEYFNQFADFSFKTFGDRVKYWITLNEPLTYTWLGYGLGSHAPGRCSDYISPDCSWIGGGGDTPTEPYIASHHSILAHAKAVQTYREKYQKEQGGKIGMNCNSNYFLPFNSSNPDDLKAVEVSLQFNYGWYNDPIVFGDYPPYMKELITGDRLPTFTDAEK